MQISTLVLGLAASLLPATAQAGCGQGFKSTIVTFEGLKDGQTVPNIFPSRLPYNWTNFQAVNYVTAGYRLRSSDNSKVGVRLTDDLGAIISSSRAVSPGYRDMPVIGSVEIGCISTYADAGVGASVDCLIGIVNQDQLTPSGFTRAHGPYNYTTKYIGNNGNSRMTKLDFPNLDINNRISFFGWLTPVYGVIVLDNIEFCYFDD